jgi:hypothetical protein
MKTLIALTLFSLSSVSFASYFPLVDISLSNDRTIHVIVTNDSGMDLNCRYSVSWFINSSLYRNEFGKMQLTVNESTELAFKNEHDNRISRINAKAVCQ